MLAQEAKWIAHELSTRVSELSPLLNVGSSTLHFRTVEQPFIDNDIFQPFVQQGGSVLHVDMKQDEGVDLAGDLMNDQFREQVKSHEIKGVLCSNLLEHVENPQLVCDLLVDVVQPAGYIIITVPHRYPYHNDPIDTMFRPDVKVIEALFPACELVNGEILTIEGSSFVKMLFRNPSLLVVTTLRALLPFYKFRSWKHIVSYIPQSFKPFQVTCVTLRKR
ncbi:MAG: methyltransferase type 11 [Bacteroidota bacterium]